MLLAGNLLSAQNESTQTWYTGEQELTQYITRTFGNGQTLSYNRIDTLRYLVRTYSNVMPTATYNAYVYSVAARVPSEYSISDIRILGDTAFFCGSKKVTGGNVALWGWVDMGYFDYLHHPTVHYYTMPDTLMSLQKLVAYHDSYNRTKVVAIGSMKKNTGNTSNYISVVADVEHATSLLPNVTVYALPFNPTNAYFSERVRSIELTRNNVVVISDRRLNNGSPLCIRTLNRNAITQVAFFPITGYNMSLYDVNGGVASTTIMDSCVAVACIHADAATGAFTTRAHVIDIEGGQNQITRSWEYPVMEKYDPIDMTYVPYDSTLAILCEEDVLYGHENFVHTLRPFASPTNSRHRCFDARNEVYSIDSLQSKYFEVSNGYTSFIQQPQEAYSCMDTVASILTQLSPASATQIGDTVVRTFTTNVDIETSNIRPISYRMRVFCPGPTVFPPIIREEEDNKE